MEGRGRHRYVGALLFLALAAGCATAENAARPADGRDAAAEGADRGSPTDAAGDTASSHGDDAATAADAPLTGDGSARDATAADAPHPGDGSAQDATAADAPLLGDGGPQDAGGEGSGDAGGCSSVIAAFAFDFESGWQGWTTGYLAGGGCADSNEWECGTPSATFWPHACAGGSGCLATDLDDHYNYNECSFARSPARDLTSCVGTPLCLQFDLAYDFVVMYGECSDGCVVQVNDTDDVDGDSWVTVAPNGGYPYPMPTSHHLPANQSAFCGTAEWASYTVPIGDALKKAAFRVRFYMDNGEVVSHFGAYADNVRLAECP